MADIEAFRLGLLRADIEERWAEAEMARGQRAAAATELEAMVEREPYREHRWVLLMSALHRAGRRAESIGAFERARRHLLDGLGIEPGPELTACARDVVAGAPDSVDDQRPRSVRHRSFVGRAAEIQEMTRRWETARSGGRSLMILAGPPGIGKTALATTMLRVASASGATTAAGRADPGGVAPFAPISDVMRELVGADGDVDLTMPGEDPIAQLTSNANAPTGSTALVARAVASRINAIAVDNGVAILLDDLHGATPDTVELLRCVWATTSMRRTLIVVTYRDTDLADDHPLRDWINEIIEGDAEAFLTLDGLTTDDFVELFTAEHGPQLHAETGGNPLLAVELWRAGPDRLDARVPPTIGVLIGSRIARLHDAARRFVDDAAVAGLSFDPVVAATAAGLDFTELGEALDQLTSAGIIEMSALSVARFVHPLMQRAVLGTLPPSRQLDGHRRLAAALERLSTGTNAERAVHALGCASDADGLIAAVRLTLAAGSDAYRQSAFSAAATWFQRGLDAHRTADLLRYELLVAKGLALSEFGTAAFRDPLFEAADIAAAFGDAEREAAALLQMNRVFTSATMIPDVELVARIAALRNRIEHRADVAAKLAACHAAEGVFLLDSDARLASEAEAIRLAHLSGDPDTLCYVLIRRITNGFDVDNADERLASLEEFNRLSRAHATLTERACGYLVEITTQLELGRLDDAERALGRLRMDTADVHDRYIQTMARVPETSMLMAHGALDRIEELTVEMERDAPDVALTVAAIRMECHRQRGDWPALLALEVPPSAATLPTYLLEIATAKAHLDEPDDGVHLLSGSLLSDIVSMPPTMIRGPCWFSAARLAVAVEWRDGFVDRLLDLIRSFSGRITTMSMSTLQGPSDHTIGLLAAHLGHRAEAESCFERAIETSTRFANEVWAAHAHVALAGLRDGERRLSIACDNAERAGIVDLSGDQIPARSGAR